MEIFINVVKNSLFSTLVFVLLLKIASVSFLKMELTVHNFVKDGLFFFTFFFFFMLIKEWLFNRNESK